MLRGVIDLFTTALRPQAEALFIADGTRVLGARAGRGKKGGVIWPVGQTGACRRCPPTL